VEVGALAAKLTGETVETDDRDVPKVGSCVRLGAELAG